MPERGPKDGPVEVRRLSDDRISISSVTNLEGDMKDHHWMELSEYNAWRIFAMLALILGVQLPAKIGKEIKM